MGRKNKHFLLFGIFILLISNVVALCETGQIDINSASKEKLDELYGIGLTKAQAIIDSRSFNSVDDLINVYGIGEKTLEKIKEQGLACVKDKETEKEEIKYEQEDTKEDVEEESFVEEIVYETEELILEEIEEKTIEQKIINLNAQNIKTEKTTEKIEKNYFKYGFAIFCFLLGLILILTRKRYKTEFE